MNDMKPPSEWILTPAQTIALDAVVKHGCHKLAAAELQVSAKTIESQFVKLRAANKFTFTVRPLHMLIAWHQYRTSSSRQTPTDHPTQ